MWRSLFLIALIVTGCGEPMSDEPGLMTASDALALHRPDPDHIIAYGDGPLQFGELRLPNGDGPFPVVMVIHGGCWLAEYDCGHISALAEALTNDGVATWSVEYRRIGDDGGGWPGTFADVGRAADHLRELVFDYELDLDRSVVLGHSAGGHLALWLAGRKWLEGDDELRGEAPQAFNGVIALAGISDLAAYASPEGCGSSVKGLLGGSPVAFPDRISRSSPIEMVPFGIEQILIVGELDPIVPLEQAERFAAAALPMGDAVDIRVVAGAGHFELIDPSADAFEVVRTAVSDILGRR